MSADESEYIRKTQELLGAIVKKPPLTDKLLSKPPFRFLHDVIMAVMKQTGFMDGLYDGDEMDAQKVNNEKDAKMAFLQKAIEIVQMANGEILAVKPAKIVAGQEANRTNEFLQAMAKAAKKGPNADLVTRVLNGEKASGDSGGSAGSNKENRDRSDSKKREEKDTSKSKEGKKESKERSSSKDRTKEKPKDSTKEKSEKPKEKEDGKARSASKEKSSKDKEKEKEKEKPRSNSKTRDGDEKKKKKEDDDGDKRSSSKSASASTKRPEEEDKKRRSSKSAKSTEEKKSDAKSDDKSKKRQSSAAAKLEGDTKDDPDGDQEPKKRSSSSKRDKEKEKEKNELGGGGLRIDLSSGHKHNGEIAEIDNRIEDESMNGAMEEERPRFASKSAVEGSRVEHDGQEATSSLKISGTIIRSGAARPSSAAGVRPGTAAGARPGTAARAAPPRMKRQELGASVVADGQNQNGVMTDPSDQIGQQQIKAPILIQTEAKKAGPDKDDDDDFIVESRDAPGVDTLILNDEDGVAGAELDGDGEHGQLVRKILETKKELESQLKTTTEKPLIVFDAQEREKTKKETGKLQELVQQLTRTSHPLAKVVDFLQEDVDSMLKELQQWKQEAKKDADLLRQETGTRTGMGIDIETLKNKLTDLDHQILEQSEAITAIRGVILNNEQRIQKMMSAVAKK